MSLLRSELVSTAVCFLLTVGASGCFADSPKLSDELQKEYDSLTKQIEANPKDYSLWGKRAVVLRKSGNLDAAEPDIEEALRCNPNWQQGYIFEAHYFVKAGKLRESIQALNEAEALSPLTAHQLAWRGAMFGKLGDFEAELKDYDKSIEKDPGNYNVLATRANLKLKLFGPSKEVVQDLEKCLKLNPTDVEDEKLLNFVRKKIENSGAK